jgi:hypothetical protein
MTGPCPVVTRQIKHFAAVMQAAEESWFLAGSGTGQREAGLGTNTAVTTPPNSQLQPPQIQLPGQTAPPNPAASTQIMTQHDRAITQASMKL